MVILKGGNFMIEKEMIIEYMKNPTIISLKNGWYSAYYAIKETFSIEEVQSMTDKEVNNLIRLANEIQLSLP